MAMLDTISVIQEIGLPAVLLSGNSAGNMVLTEGPFNQGLIS